MDRQDGGVSPHECAVVTKGTPHRAEAFTVITPSDGAEYVTAHRRHAAHQRAPTAR